MAYSYLASAFIGLAIARFRHRGRVTAASAGSEPASDRRDSAAR
jgi:hypothetical protein